MIADPEQECKLCLKERIKAGENPIRMVILPEKTSRKNLDVQVCDLCDGGIANLVRLRRFSQGD